MSKNSGCFIHVKSLLLLAIIAMLPIGGARADAPSALARLVATPISRMALQTSQGRALFKALGLGREDFNGLLKLAGREGAAPLREGLETSLARIEAELAELRLTRARNGNPLADGVLTAEEKIFVELLSRRLLALADTAAFSRRFAPSTITFIEETAGAAGLARNEAIFRTWEMPARLGLGLPTERAAETATAQAGVAGEAAARSGPPRPVAESSPGVSRSLTRRIGEFFDKMRYCTLHQPPAQASANRLTYFFTSLGINEAIIAGSYVVGMGQENFSLEELTTDLLVGAVYTVANVSMLRPNQRFLVSWVKVTGAILAQDGADSIIYFISPLHRITSGGESLHTPQEAFTRLGFNAGYTLLSNGWREVLMYELINGIMCLYPGSKMARIGTTALRIGDSTLSTIIYFRARREMVGH